MKVGDMAYVIENEQHKTTINFYKIKEIIETEKCLQYKMTNNTVICACQIFDCFEKALEKCRKNKYFS